MVMRADGSGQPQRLLDLHPPVRPWSFSPDGKVLVFDGRTEAYAGTLFATVAIDLADPEHPKAGKPEPLLNSGRLEVDAAVSHDGHWIAYASQEAGREQVFVQPFPASTAGGKWRVSSEGGKFPTWSYDGRKLFFFGPDDRVRVMEYTAKGDTFTASKPRAWYERRIVRTGVTRNYDLAPDGKRIVAFVRPPRRRRGSIR
jgi:Tol biopolymer transport system component